MLQKKYQADERKNAYNDHEKHGSRESGWAVDSDLLQGLSFDLVKIRIGLACRRCEGRVTGIRCVGRGLLSWSDHSGRQIGKEATSSRVNRPGSWEFEVSFTGVVWR